MPINWNGYDSGLKAGVAALITSVVGPLPYTYSVQQGLRSIPQQNALYAQGRSVPGAIVTDAIGGSSPHNYGMAVDLYPVVGGTLDWGTPPAGAAQAAWQALWAAIAANPYLLSGVGFVLANGQNDPGHVEIKNWEVYENIPLPNAAAAVASAPVTASAVPANPDGTPTYNGGDYNPLDTSNPYNQNPTNPDGSPTYNGEPYDPSDPDNPYTIAGGLPPAPLAKSGGLSMFALLAVVAVVGVGYMAYRRSQR
jgi:hypothetical protein